MHCQQGQRPFSRELLDEINPSREKLQVSVWSPKPSQSSAIVSCCDPDCLNPLVSLLNPAEPKAGFHWRNQGSCHPPLLLTQWPWGS